MNRRFWLIVVMFAVVSAIAARYVYRKRRAAANSAAVQAAFLKYSQNLKPGMTRKEVKDYLRDQGLAFLERCCHKPGAPFSVLIRVGEEDSPWYCSEWYDYVAFEFATAEPLDWAKRSDSDLLEKVHQTSNGEGCL